MPEHPAVEDFGPGWKRDHQRVQGRRARVRQHSRWLDADRTTGMHVSVRRAPAKALGHLAEPSFEAVRAALRALDSLEARPRSGLDGQHGVAAATSQRCAGHHES